jgi:intergrase/recombinase
MKALSALSKFLGIYDEFKALVRNYGLKWAGKSSDEIVIARITKSVDGNDMFNWMRKVKAVCLDFSDFIDFVAVTGLRYEEAVNAWNLIIELNQQNKLNKYYKKDKKVLEHFRFKKIFIRRSKKAFISFVPNSLITKIVESKKLTVGILPNRLKRRKMKLRFGDIRELHCSFLTRYLRQPEIDFLHGRVSTNVFMRNYFNPVWISDLQKRALKAAKQILAEIN